jgi:hypothetical protein
MLFAVGALAADVAGWRFAERNAARTGGRNG